MDDTEFTYCHANDFYGYQPYGKDCWYIEGRNGAMLIGSGLPSTEEQAQEYCRIANIAYEEAVKNTVVKFTQAFNKIAREIN
jgi:hypothetical protein